MGGGGGGPCIYTVEWATSKSVIVLNRLSFTADFIETNKNKPS